FIRNLPAELLKAFESTLEELYEADLLVHVIDVSNPSYREQIDVVEKLLRDLELDAIPRLQVFNKIDRVDENTLNRLSMLDGIAVSAIDEKTLAPFIEQAQDMLYHMIEVQPENGKP
ncbi:MAG: GTPase HflX, partial [Desulfobulbaceae bacterium]|nr:GTPase HflX [Desulfobulbaceae bacterium]